ncbi:MAG: HAD family phosphatase [Oscillospiraceae bacterium]
MIKNIVFDVGGVVVRWDPASILAELVPDSPYHEELIQEIFTSDEWPLMDQGAITGAEATQNICSRLTGPMRDDALHVMRGWQNCLPLHDGILELMKELKSHGHGVFILSNASDNFYDIPTLHEPLALVDGALVSCEERLAKPDERIYRRFFEKFSLIPQECLFTDDLPANVAGSRAAGMDAVVFKSVAAFRLELIKRELI